MSTNTPSLAELKRVAEAATPGPWRWMNRRTLVGDHGPRPVVLACDGKMEIRHKDSGMLVELTPSWSDPEYIATFDPQTAGRLIQALEIYEKALADTSNHWHDQSDEVTNCSACNARAEIRRLIDFGGNV
jgi:hypothetical protein